MASDMGVFLWSIDGFEQAGKQCRARGKLTPLNMFVRGMRSCAGATKPVERRHAEGGGKIAIGAAAAMRLRQRDAELFGERAGGVVKRCDTRCLGKGGGGSSRRRSPAHNAGRSR
jgi:hypothetical protein